MIDKQKVRELRHLVMKSDGADNVVIAFTEWLEQNLPEPIVVGLSDEQIGIFGECFDYSRSADDAEIQLTGFLKTETFAQPQKFTPNWDDAPRDAVEYSVIEYYTTKEGNTCKSVTLHEEQRPKPTPQVGQVWKHVKNGTDYTIRILGGLYKNDKDWEECITYQSNASDDFYTRTLTDFLSRFERVS